MPHFDFEGVPVTLQQLLAKARETLMSEAQREEQRQSFAYGNSHFENETITRETVRRESEKLKAADGGQK
ncbi:MAG: hypothetical protein WD851_06935 [Pirellulales bacterium]